MEQLEEQIKIEYYRLAEKTGIYPSYLHISHEFYDYLILNSYNMSLSINLKNYMNMEIKRSLDLRPNEFLLSFNIYEL